MANNLHHLAEERSLALHRLIAAELSEDSAALAKARARVTSWIEHRRVSSRYAEAWHAALQGSLEELKALLSDPGEHARALRQVSPFAGAVDARTRWRVWREVRRNAAL